jgi:hypothetical protein
MRANELLKSPGSYFFPTRIFAHPYKQRMFLWSLPR